jgi:hypothetical protein
MCFHDGPKKIQGHHIKNQMHIVCVNESAGDKPVILMFFIDAGRPENQFIDDSGLTESGYRNETRNKNNGQGNGNTEHGK